MISIANARIAIINLHRDSQAAGAIQMDFAASCGFFTVTSSHFFLLEMQDKKKLFLNNKIFQLNLSHHIIMRI